MHDTENANLDWYLPNINEAKSTVISIVQPSMIFATVEY